MLHTPVTSAPNVFAICTANVPTPPDAPLIRTLSPGLTLPLSRRPCKAVTPAIGTHAAWSNVTLAGFNTMRFVRKTAHILGQGPVSPAKHFVARLEPRHVFADCFDCPCVIHAERVSFGLNNPNASKRAKYGEPSMKCQSSGLMAAARTLTRT